MLRSALLHAAIAGTYMLLAVVHTYPLLLNLGSHLPGAGAGDNVAFLWNLWWMREAAASPDYEFLYSPLLFAPFGASLVLHTHTALAALGGATVLGSRSTTEAQNLILLASLIFNGLAAYALAYQVTRARTASIAAGALVLVAPALTGRLMGHFNLILVWPLILACIAFIAWLRNSTMWRSAAAGVAAGLIPYADYYYTTYFLLFVIVYTTTDRWALDLRLSRRRPRTLSRALIALALVALGGAIVIRVTGVGAAAVGTFRISLRSPTNALTLAWILTLGAFVAGWRMHPTWTQRETKRRPSAAAAALAIAVFLLVISPFIHSGWRLWRSGDYVTQSSALRSTPRGIDVATIVMGPPFSGVVGGTVRDAYARHAIDPMEASAWMGGAFTILLVLAGRSMRHAHDMRRWGAIGAVFAIWSLGPYLQVLGANTGVLLPQALAQAIPILNNARIPGRAMAVVTLCGAVLIASLLAQAATTRRAALWVLTAFAIVESIAAPLTLVRLPDVSIYERVRSDPDVHAAVLTVPFGIRDGFGQQGLLQHDALYAQSLHRHAMAGGFLARLPPAITAWYEKTEPYRTLLRLSDGRRADVTPPCDHVVRGLREGSVSYVMVDRGTAPAAVVAFVEERMPLRLLDRRGMQALFKVAPERCAAPSVAPDAYN